MAWYRPYSSNSQGVVGIDWLGLVVVDLFYNTLVVTTHVYAWFDIYGCQEVLNILLQESKGS